MRNEQSNTISVSCGDTIKKPRLQETTEQATHWHQQTKFLKMTGGKEEGNLERKTDFRRSIR